MKDLERARRAFGCADEAWRDEAARAEYRSRVHALGPNVLREGLAAAVTFLEREQNKKPAARLLLRHLSQAELPGLDGKNAENFAGAVRALEVDDYILATREALRVCLWLRRAVQAWPDDAPAPAPGEAA